ncbi:MAG: tRNA pseudouridine(13) synthase TruD [Gammaproteobacteria bacterium]|nr:tRNA pseudouridine(13) synthase TruD [Gammaproteobacteria bacterium]
MNTSGNFDINNLNTAYNGPRPSVLFKQSANDFIVTENISFEPENRGTHAFLKIQKKSTNTQWVIKELAKFCQVPEKSIGYAGLKDRHAITTQWFSVNLEGITEPDWDKFNVDNIEIIEHCYHPRKLKIGTIDSNHFIIRLKNVSPEHLDTVEKIQSQIQSNGFANYFGEQRFGIDEQNIVKARKWFNGQYKVKQKSKKSLYLSAARSMLFNTFLSSRIEQFGFNQLINGEVMLLDGNRSFFTAEKITDEIRHRFLQGDIHPSLCLWGQGEPASASELKTFELAQAEQASFWAKHLIDKGLKQDRRAIRVIPKELKSQYIESKQTYQLEFLLPSGSYATMLLREMFYLQQPNRE